MLQDRVPCSTAQIPDYYARGLGLYECTTCNHTDSSITPVAIYLTMSSSNNPMLSNELSSADGGYQEHCHVSKVNPSAFAGTNMLACPARRGPIPRPNAQMKHEEPADLSPPREKPTHFAYPLEQTERKGEVASGQEACSGTRSGNDSICTTPTDTRSH